MVAWPSPPGVSTTVTVAGTIKWVPYCGCYADIYYSKATGLPQVLLLPTQLRQSPLLLLKLYNGIETQK